MAQDSIMYRVVQSVGIVLAGGISGTILGIQPLTLPSFLLAPTPLLLRQWNTTYENGKRLSPPIAATSASSFAYLAYRSLNSQLPSDNLKGKLYAAAAVAVISIVPYTILFMATINSKLIAKNEELIRRSDPKEEHIDGGESAKELVDRWGALNLVRGLFPLVGAILGVWASIS
ncbi:hypothetical protein MMC06_004246 [Schaereria dolodes]|nr:hypothetical protein [Schaereria dolodes]